MHGEYPLLAHTFIQTRVGTPRGAPLSGASLFLKVPTGHPSVKPKAHLSLCSTFLIRLLLFFPQVAGFEETLMREYMLGRSSGILLNVWQQSPPLSAHFCTAQAL